MAKKQARPVDIEVVDAPASPDQQLVSTDGDKLREFLGGLSRFFARAGEIERSAKERLDVARQFKAPTDAASDEKIQVALRETKAEIAVAEEHWTITAVVFNLHRRLTSARGRTTGKDSKGVPIGMLDQAVAILQNHHNRYTEDAKRKAREEEDRLNREAEERARADRERELARLEEEAVKAETQRQDLSERETTFAKLVAGGGNSSDAARTAGYKDPDAQAARLLKTPKIVEAIAQLRTAANLRKQATATRAMPVEVEKVEVRPDITKAAGSYDLTTWSAEVFDEDALVAAMLDPRTRATLGIPSDIVTVKPTKLNEYAGSLQELINKWPGVRAVKKTTTVGR